MIPRPPTRPSARPPSASGSTGSAAPPARPLGNTYKSAVVNSHLQLGEDDPSLERLFSSHIKIMPFTHRALYSVRHPFVQHTVMGAREGAAAGPRGQPQDVLQKIKLKAPIHAQHEERKWVELGHLIDAVVGEDALVERRVEVLGHGAFEAQLELLWRTVVPKERSAMTKPAYIDVTCAAWKHFVGPHVESGPEFFKVMLRGAEHDWSVDVPSGEDEMPYGQFAVAMLELIDTWVPTSKPEDYAGALAALLPEVMNARPKAAPEPAGEAVASPAVGKAPPTGWAAKKEAIAKGYYKGAFHKLGGSVVRVRPRPVTGLGEYYVDNTPMEESEQ